MPYINFNLDNKLKPTLFLDGLALSKNIQHAQKQNNKDWNDQFHMSDNFHRNSSFIFYHQSP